MTFEKLLLDSAGYLPRGWKIRIEVENGWGGVKAIRPDESEIDLDDGESDLTEQLQAAIRVAFDEEEANAIAAD